MYFSTLTDNRVKPVASLSGPAVCAQPQACVGRPQAVGVVRRSGRKPPCRPESRRGQSRPAHAPCRRDRTASSREPGRRHRRRVLACWDGGPCCWDGLLSCWPSGCCWPGCQRRGRLLFSGRSQREVSRPSAGRGHRSSSPRLRPAGRAPSRNANVYQR